RVLRSHGATRGDHPRCGRKGGGGVSHRPHRGGRGARRAAARRGALPQGRGAAADPGPGHPSQRGVPDCGVPAMRNRFAGLLLVLLGAGFAAPALAQASPGTMAIGRLHYDGGGDWYANPSALPNLIAAARQRTGLRLAEKEKVVRLVDDDIWNVAYLTVTGHGNLRWSEQELAILRRWLVAGGFLHVSDNYGLDESFRREVARLFP